jgi:hypothetical protein
MSDQFEKTCRTCGASVLLKDKGELWAVECHRHAPMSVPAAGQMWITPSSEWMPWPRLLPGDWCFEWVDND